MLKTGMIIAERYEIVSKIGTGGMADVYKAMDHKLNRFVAVKVLKPEFREDATFVKKFRSEAQAAAGLTHPNIVNVFDVGDDEGVYYIVMELIEGITLKEYISKKGKLSVKEATSIAIQVSMGLEAAHSHGIVHRDVKPQNIIISTDGKVKVTDFGIARAASSNTISSNVMGSVHYMASVMRKLGRSPGWKRAVGWNCINSMSFTAPLARYTIAMPSPVATSGLVVLRYTASHPPVAITVTLDRNVSTSPVFSFNT